MQSKNEDWISKEIPSKIVSCADAVRVRQYFGKHAAETVTSASVTSVYTQCAVDKSIYQSASVTGFLLLTHEEFWLASHPDNGAEPVHAAGGDIGVVHTADSSFTDRSHRGSGPHTALV